MVRSAALALVVAVVAIGPGSAQQPADKPPEPLTPQEWADALKVAREIALDTSRPVEQRANAMMAYARMQLARNQPAEALQTCWAVFDNPKEQAVAEAAARAACLVTRNTGGCLWGQRRLLEEWAQKAKGPASRQALKVVRDSHARITAYLMGLAGARPTPPPIRPAMPHWGQPAPNGGPGVFRFGSPPVVAPPWLTAQPGQGLRMFQVPVPVIQTHPCLGRDNSGIPNALRLALPEYTPPEWYRRVQFPPLKGTEK
ncbi:MAG: hypothetical protein AMJ81_09075 [Phycisphaerae bacterium SM23_33]|nr:MAG: hypothetical protein AMJ81_09075 [Phycisphaerae bacterium SM23_33]